MRSPPCPSCNLPKPRPNILTACQSTRFLMPGCACQSSPSLKTTCTFSATGATKPIAPARKFLNTRSICRPLIHSRKGWPAGQLGCAAARPYSEDLAKPNRLFCFWRFVAGFDGSPQCFLRRTFRRFGPPKLRGPLITTPPPVLSAREFAHAASRQARA